MKNLILNYYDTLISTLAKSMSTLPQPISPRNVTKPLTSEEIKQHQDNFDDWKKWKLWKASISELCLGCETGTDHDGPHTIIDHNGETIYHPDCYKN